MQVFLNDVWRSGSGCDAVVYTLHNVYKLKCAYMVIRENLQLGIAEREREPSYSASAAG